MSHAKKLWGNSPINIAQHNVIFVKKREKSSRRGFEPGTRRSELPNATPTPRILMLRRAEFFIFDNEWGPTAQRQQVINWTLLLACYRFQMSTLPGAKISNNIPVSSQSEQGTLRGVVVRTFALRPRGLGFESRSLREPLYQFFCWYPVVSSGIYGMIMRIHDMFKCIPSMF